MTENDDVRELTDGADHINENQAFDEIKKILAHPGLRNPENLRRRLWVYLHMLMSSKF